LRCDQKAYQPTLVLVEFENPGAKTFNVEVKSYRDGTLLKTEPFKDFKEGGSTNSGIAGDAATTGTGGT
jgi:hypothetical protein